MNADPIAHITQLLQQLQNTKSTISTEKSLLNQLLQISLLTLAHHIT